MAGDRHSVAEVRELITDPDEKARREAENGVRQFNLATEIIREHIHDQDRPFRFAPRYILQLHGAALDGIHPLAGTYRNSPVDIHKSKHEPPESWLVPEFVTEMCGYVNDNWDDKTPIHLASYVLWRLNWIHPFADGNGRTARICMYLVLSIKLDSILPGTPTIPDQIASDKTPYYHALEAADEALKAEAVDVSEMEELIERMLSLQAVNAIKQATTV